MSEGAFGGAGRQSLLRTMELGSTLQRLFSTFPNSWPGLGLLLIRLSLGAALIYFSTGGPPWNPPEPVTFAQKSIAAAAGLFLLAGLWTPAIGILSALNSLSIALFLPSAHPDDMWIHIFLAAIAASVAMLGPGAWSLDARLYGRKRFDIDRTGSGKPYL